jgi:hypothetical protein
MVAPQAELVKRGDLHPAPNFSSGVSEGMKGAISGSESCV